MFEQIIHDFFFNQSPSKSYENSRYCRIKRRICLDREWSAKWRISRSSNDQSSLEIDMELLHPKFHRNRSKNCWWNILLRQSPRDTHRGEVSNLNNQYILIICYKPVINYSPLPYSLLRIHPWFQGVGYLGIMKWSLCIYRFYAQPRYYVELVVNRFICWFSPNS